MKKILLISALFCGAVFFGYGQTVLNETYSNPGAGNSEFIELYNSSTLGAQQLDCFTILTLWTTSATVRGWYVLDLPASTVASKSWYVLAAADPYTVQGGSGLTPDVNWNDATFRSGATGGYLKKYQVNAGGTGYNEINITGISQFDVLAPADDMASGQNRLTLLFQNGVFINGFWGGGNTGTLPAFVTGLPDLVVTPAGACGGVPFTIHFASTPSPPPANTTNVGAVEFVNQSAGNDNGYRRLTDGKCASWNKASSSANHTPGATNGSAAGAAGALTTSQLIVCNTPRYVTFDITGVSGGVTEADDFPVEIQVYNDINHNQQLDGADVFIKSKSQATVAAPADTIQLTGANQNADVIVIYKTKRGCFDKVVAVLTSCSPLPVHFGTFTAKRTSSSNVNLVWTTLTELNNTGFEVQRNINGNWETMTFIPTQAANGNSDAMLTYTYHDMNSAKGMTQYRIKQIDFDGKSEFTSIRAVRGEGQPGKTIIYPNPSMNGKINVVFEDVSVTRSVTLTDMTGRIVQQWRTVTNNNLQIENLNPGIYMLRIIVPDTGEQTTEKIVVNDR